MIPQPVWGMGSLQRKALPEVAGPTREPFWKGNRSTFHRAVARESACRKGRQGVHPFGGRSLAHLLRACGSPIAPFLQARWNQPSRCTQGKREFETDQATLLENGSGLAPREAKPDHWVSYAVASMQWKLVANNDLSHFELFDLEKIPSKRKISRTRNPMSRRICLPRSGKWKSTLPAKPTGNVFSGLRKTSK